MTTASGSAIGSRRRIGAVSMRQKAITGAPIRSEAREGLGLQALLECGQRQKLGGRDDALPAAAVEADLEHGGLLGPRVLEQQAPLGRGDQSAGALDSVDVDRNGVYAGADEQ